MNKDVLLTHANIITLDDNHRIAGSILVKDGMIKEIWQQPEPGKDVRDQLGRIEVFNVKGKTVIPGFVDTHNHILSYGLMKRQVNCGTPPHRTIDDMLQAISRAAEETPQGEWILGWGYDDTLLAEQRHPTRQDLDQAAPHQPVLIEHVSSHLAAVNSRAIQIAGLHDYVEDPAGGRFGRDSDGKINGVLYEPGAQKPFMAKMPKPSQEQMITTLREAALEYAAQGITTNTDAHVKNIDQLQAQLEAVRRGENPLHMRLMLSHLLMRQGEAFAALTASQLDQRLRDQSGGRARLDSAKIFQDGSIQGLTGALRQPYFNQSDWHGELFFNQQTLQEEMLDLHLRGFRLAFHGNGDRAIGSIIDGLAYALGKSPKNDHRHRIEHVQTATTEDLDRMKELGIAASFFINHVYFWGDRHQRLFLGPERARRINPLQDALARDLLFTLHSDCPITPISPLFSIWCAVNRITREGNILGEEQCCSALEALKAMTLYGAMLNHEEQEYGSLEIGKRGDLAVLEEDPLRVDPRDIKDIRVAATFTQGSPIYHK